MEEKAPYLTRDLSQATELEEDPQFGLIRPTLTDQDHSNMDAFLGAVLDDNRNDVITRETAIGSLAHVMAALRQDNYPEVRSWFEQGRKFVRD
ncbi:MAG: hypothetical protein AB2604_01600 [Candidatus Thiodiazotropha taylori]